MTKRILAFALTLVFAMSICYAPIRSIGYAKEIGEKTSAVKNNITKAPDLGAKDAVTIMVELEGETALEKSQSNVKSSMKYSDELKTEQKKAKKAIEKVLHKEIIVKNNYTLLFNGFSFEGTVDMIEKINTLDGVMAFAAPVFEVPETIASSELVHATEMWNMGYTGKGTSIAIVDTGICSKHEAFSVNPPSPKFDKKAIEKVFAEYGEYMHAHSRVDGLYISEKIPFAFDYYETRYGAEHSKGAGDHGTHVAGIAAGNNGVDFKGIAYDAQIFAMQVFTTSGGASWDNIILALEDCAYLGVDALNMSLGSAAGFSTYAEESYGKVFELLQKAGVAVSASAGNEGSTASDNSFSGYQLADNPDSGLVGSPSTWEGCLSVASSDNATVGAGSIKVGNDEFGFLDPFKGTEAAFERLAGKYDYVICGTGTVDEMKNLDLTNKVAVISRGGITFTEKAQNAADKGAVAAIIYNNQEGVINMSIEYSIPAVSILQTDGAKLVSAATNGMGKLEIKDGTFIDYSTANVISSFSSRGTTSDLKIKPEITAPGGNITSAIGLGEDDEYATWSGTSMSAPHVAAGLAIIKQYVKEKFPNKSASEQLDITYAILMSTAKQLDGELVRSQGAGLIDLEAALSTNSYLSVNNNARPKLELGEIDGDTFKLVFNVTNFGKNSVTYKIHTGVDLDTPYVAGNVDGQPLYVTNFKALDVSEDCDITAKDSVKVDAGKTVKVEITVKMHSDLLDDIHEIFKSGSFIEGFVTLTPEASTEGVKDAELSIPYLGFAGDWDIAAVIDYGYYWQDATGEFNPYSNSYLPYNYVGYAWDADELTYGAGINPYSDGTMPTGSFTYDRITVSPGKSDIDYIAFSLLRNIKALNLHLEDETGNIIEYLTDYEDYMWRKEFSNNGEYSYSDIQFDIDYSRFEENTTIHLVLETELDHEGFDLKMNQNAKWDIPITIDKTAPFITNISYKNSKFEIKALDTNYIAKIALFADAEHNRPIEEKLYYSDMRACEEMIKADINSKENPFVYIAVYDYAGNERSYVFNTTDNKLTEQSDISQFAQQVITWSESFEDSSTYALWDTLDADGDGNEWNIGESKDLASDGKLFAYSYSYDTETESALTPDNWIVSPEVSIPDDGHEYYISFDIAATDYPETYALLIADSDATSTDDFETLYSSPISGSDYNTITVSLAEYAGKNVIFAWRHYNCSDGYILRLDNIKLYYLDAFSANAPLYKESFETTTKWTTYDADGDGKTFINVSREGLASDGKHAMYSKAFDTDTSTQLKVDNWLISEAIDLPKTPALLYLGFDSISSLDAHDYFEVYIGTTPNVKDMTSLIYAGNSDNEWRTTVLELTAYAGNKIYIGFRHITNDGVLLGIDNVNVYKIDKKAEYTVTFRSSYTNEILGISRFEEGEKVTGFPKAPQYDTYTFVSWNYNGAAVTRDITIMAEYRCRGDINLDEVLNTGDAVYILRAMAYETELTDIESKVGDYNRDGVVNTGDATAILRYLVGLK